jgi:hypothetical protein
VDRGPSSEVVDRGFPTGVLRNGINGGGAFIGESECLASSRHHRPVLQPVKVYDCDD